MFSASSPISIKHLSGGRGTERFATRKGGKGGRAPSSTRQVREARKRVRLKRAGFRTTINEPARHYRDGPQPLGGRGLLSCQTEQLGSNWPEGFTRCRIGLRRCAEQIGCERSWVRQLISAERCPE